MEVDVEILDVTEEEARKLLLTIDPLAALAETQEQLHQRLLEQTPTDNNALAAAWEAAAAEVLQREPEPLGAIPEQFLILMTCRDEKQQVELLARFGAEGLACRVMMTRRKSLSFGKAGPPVECVESPEPIQDAADGVESVPGSGWLATSRLASEVLSQTIADLPDSLRLPGADNMRRD
jgi:hypothetical protein